MNVIFLMNDTFRRDHLGCYGNDRIHTPNLDQFARHAAIFEQFYSASYPTVPNRWDLSTGRYGFPARGWQPLDPEDVGWGQILGRQGVHTQMIWDTPMLAMHDYNYTRGFQGRHFVHGQKGDPYVVNSLFDLKLPAQPHKIRNMSSMTGYLANHHQRLYEREFCVGRTISAAMDWLETNYSRHPFFLWIDMWDPHEPFDCPWYDYQRYANSDYDGDIFLYPEYGRATYMTETEREHTRALYAGSVTLVDRWTGHLFDLLERLNLLRNTIVIWASDHGHLFGEHDLQGKPGAELGTLYEESIHIPLLVYHPAGIGAGERVTGFVQPPDILPSILDAMEIPIPAFIEGQSFWPLVSDNQAKLRDFAVSNRFPPSAGSATYTAAQGAVFDGWVGSDRNVEPATITTDDWACLCAPEGMPSELYNLKDDPQQTNNVIDQHPEIAADLRRQWLDFLREYGASEARLRPFIDGNVEVNTPAEGKLFAFRDDQGQWIAFDTAAEARRRAYQPNAPGRPRSVKETTFGAILDDDSRNLIHLYGQYYWAEDLA